MTQKEPLLENQSLKDGFGVDSKVFREDFKKLRSRFRRVAWNS